MTLAARGAARPRPIKRRAPPDLFSHRTRHVQMNGRLVDSDTLVVTFAPRATDAAVIWGQAPLQKLGHSVLSFVDFADAWFPSGDMAELKAAVESRLGRYCRVVTYGHSMGGYGALKYGRLFSAVRSVGLGPAWSVAPQDIGAFDRRRPRLYYRPELHDGMAIRPDDLADEAIVVFDPGHREDSAHVAAMARAGCPVKQARNYFVGHDLLSPCIDGGNGSGLVREIANGNGVGGLRNTIRASRRASPRYVSGALDATFDAGRLTFARRIAEHLAMPLADKPSVRKALIRQNYTVPDLPAAHDWHERFLTGSADIAVKAASNQPQSDFLKKASLVRRWLTVHSEVGAFEPLAAFVGLLIADGRWRGDEYTSFAAAVLKGGKARAHYLVLEPLLERAGSVHHNAEKLQMIRIGADLMLRGETHIPSSLFSSAYFLEPARTDLLVLPPKKGEFVRSLALYLPPGDLRITFDMQVQGRNRVSLSPDVLRKSGRSIQPLLRVLLGIFTAGLRGRSGRAASINVRVPEPKKRREPRVNIILKSDGGAAGDTIRFHGVHIVRVSSWVR